MVRAVRTGPPADRNADRLLSGGTVDWGCFRFVTTQNQSVTVNFDHRRPLNLNNIKQGLQYRVVRTGPPADWYADHLRSGGTARQRLFPPVTTRNRLVTVNFDCRWPISGGINRGREKEEGEEEGGEKPRVLFAHAIHNFMTGWDLGIVRLRQMQLALQYFRSDVIEQ
ncbi:hypothetical protein BHE74_00033961 [Ensete ventricosum]|nr:hypothetical protein BHE74_00033961 [Ensete ventricosum]